jgi:hypothetical protein
MAKQTKAILKIKVNGVELEIIYPSKASLIRACNDYIARSESKLTITH